MAALKKTEEPFFYREAFLDAIEQHCPAALESLRSDVSPFFSNRFVLADYPQARTLEDLNGLAKQRQSDGQEALWGWLEARLPGISEENVRRTRRDRFNPIWFVEVVRSTVAQWGRVSPSPPLKFDRQFEWPQGLPRGAIVRQGDAREVFSEARRLDGAGFESWGAFSGSNEKPAWWIGVPDPAPRFVFDFPAFDPFRDWRSGNMIGREDWEQGCRRAFRQFVARHLSEVDTTAPPNKEHVKWTALRLFGENDDGSFGWTQRQLAKRFSTVPDDSKFSRAVRAVLRRLEFSFLVRPGRPRKAG